MTVKIHIVGECATGGASYANVYRFCETYGVSLADVLHSLSLRSGCVSWVHYYAEATSAGMKSARIFSRIEEALVDVYPAGGWRVVLEEFKKTIKESDK